MSRDLELLTEIRDLLQVLAEPALAKRDAKLRSALRGLVGKGQKKGQAALMMDGTRSPASISKATGIDQGNLSRLIKSLSKHSLLAAGEKYPRLVMKVPANFFENGEETDE